MKSRMYAPVPPKPITAITSSLKFSARSRDLCPTRQSVVKFEHRIGCDVLHDAKRVGTRVMQFNRWPRNYRDVAFDLFKEIQELPGALGFV